MSTNKSTPSWKVAAKAALTKTAAQQPSQGGAGQQQDPGSVDAATLERNFCDQAYQTVQNSAMPFIQAGKQLGFEVVFKNPDCSKMVGIFIFKVSSKELYYAPVLFIAGQVKSDLLYRVNTKTFVPLTPDWCDYFLQHNPATDGKGVDPSVKMHANNYADLVSLIQPPRFRKFASDAPINLFESDVAELLEKTASVVFDEKFNEAILRKFIVEDGGYDSIKKIASAAKSYEFANALFMSCDSEDSFAPDLASLDKAAALAAAGAPPQLAIYQDLLNNPLVKSASGEDLARNYKIVDNRKEADLNSVTWEAGSTELDGIGQPGIFEVVMADGSRSKCLVANADNEMLHAHPAGCSCCSYLATTSHKPRAKERADLILVELASLNSKHVPGRHITYGKYVEDILDKNPSLETSMKAGKMYRVYSRLAKALSSPIYVKSVGKTTGDLAEYTTGSDISATADERNNKIYIYNPDYDGVIDDDGVIGGAYRFVEVAFKKTTYGSVHHDEGDLNPGESASLNAWIFSEGYKKATLTKLANSTDYLVRRADGEKNSPVLTKLGAKLLMMNELDMTGDAADERLSLAKGKSQQQFFYKAAQQLQWRQFPEFYQQFNQDFNVPEEDQNYQKYMVLAQGNYPMQLRHRVGDGIKLNNPNQDTQGNSIGGIPGNMSDTNNVMRDSGMNLDTATPQSLYQLSQQKGVGNLFEHGVIGSLVKTYDSVALIDKYLPNLEQALDRLGRIVFLLYWKPEDFIKAYGADDQTELENKLLSNFKALGELVLELLLKSKTGQQGSPGLQ